jgi:hypothetical protein
MVQPHPLNVGVSSNGRAIFSSAARWKTESVKQIVVVVASHAGVMSLGDRRAPRLEASPGAGVPPMPARP